MTLLFTNAAALLLLMTCIWLISLPLRNVSIIDIAWGLGFVVVAWTSAIQFEIQSSDVRQWLLPVLTTVWGTRLAVHLAWRNLGTAEDRRYAALRKAGGGHFWWSSLFTVFWLQGCLIWIVALPLQLPAVPGAKTRPWVWILGIAVWGTGFVFEALGDWQLMRFKARSANHAGVMDRGLWKYTRHPNYFGDCCIWWGLYLIALGLGRHEWTIISPILMSILLVRISGVTLLERDLKELKPDYAAYMRRTSAFFPLPPRDKE